MAFATESQVLAQLAAMQRTILRPIDGVPMAAYDSPPDMINPGNDGPLFVNIVGPLIEREYIDSDDLAQEFKDTRIYFMRLYYAKMGTGYPGEVYQGFLVPYFDLVEAKFGGAPHLNNLGGITKAMIIQDTGAINNLPWAGDNYYGIMFSLRVISRNRRPFAPDE